MLHKLSQLEHSRSREFVRFFRTGGISVISTLGILLVLSSIANVRVWAETKNDRIVGRTAVQLMNLVEDSTDFRKYVYPVIAREETCKEMARLGYLHLNVVKTKCIREIATPSSTGPSGWFDTLTVSGIDHFAVSGWSVWPERKEVAVVTLLTYDDDYGQPKAFAAAVQNTPRADVARVLNNERFLDSGWYTTIETKVLPPGRRTLRAWAFDPETCRVHELNGMQLIAANL